MKFSELVKGFRTNVRDGVPCELKFTGRTILLTAADTIIGEARRPKPRNIPRATCVVCGRRGPIAYYGDTGPVCQDCAAVERGSVDPLK